MWLRFCLGCGLVLIPCSLLALDPSRSLFQYNCQNWKREHGLPANGINSIAQTKDGFLWIGTQMGLVRFDGLEFKLFKLPNEPQFRNQVIASLCSSRHGGLWFGIRDGSLGYYSAESGFRSLPNEGWVEPGMNVASIKEASDGSVWVGTGKGTTHWWESNVQPAKTYDELKYTLTLSEDSHHRIWLGTAEKGVYYWQNGKLTQFPDAALAGTAISAVAEDSFGQLWIGTQVGLRCYDASFRPKDVPFSHAEIKALMVDRQGALWIGTTGEGLARYKDGSFSSFRKSDGLADDTVTALFEDSEGSVWVGTRNGLSQISDVKLPIYSETEGLPNRACHSVSPSRRGGLWAGTSLGISRLEGKTIANYAPDMGLSSRYIKQVLEARDGDIYLFNGNKEIAVLSQGKVVASYTNSNWPTCLAEDAQGVVAAVGAGLFRVSRSEFTPLTYVGGAAPPIHWVRSLMSSRDGSVLVASVNGIFRVKNGVFERWPTDTAFLGRDVLWLHEDSEGVIWAGLRTAIARIKNKQIHTITRDDGLFDNSIFGFITDDHGWCWANSTRGIFRVSRKALNDFADGKIRKVECLAYDGLEAVKTVDTTEVEFGSACKTVDGRVWFPSPQGIVMIDPNNLITNPVPPRVHIQQVRANGRELGSGRSLSVEPGKGELEIQYTALSFIAPKKVHFRYRLEGYDPEWVDAGVRRSAFYTNLKPGKYRFQVQACNADGMWNILGDNFAIELPPQFHQTLWFRVLCGLSGAAAMAGLYVWRVEHVRRKEKKLQKLNDLLESRVRERTRELLEVSRQAGMAEVATSVLHNVGNVLNSVNVSASIVHEKIQKSSAANMAKVLELLRRHESDLAAFFAGNGKGQQLISYMDALVQNVSAEKAEVLQEIKGLAGNVDHIKEIVAMQQTYARVSGVTEVIEVSELAEDALRINALTCARHGVALKREFSAVQPITVDRHKAIQILVNLLQNAVQACEATGLPDLEITVRISASGTKRIQIEVKDNGVGIPAENLTRIFSHGFTTRKNGHGFGLHSGALAAKEMGGRLTSRSDGPGKGATFTLELPVEPKPDTATSPASEG